MNEKTPIKKKRFIFATIIGALVLAFLCLGVFIRFRFAALSHTHTDTEFPQEYTALVEETFGLKLPSGTALCYFEYPHSGDSLIPGCLAVSVPSHDEARNALKKAGYARATGTTLSDSFFWKSTFTGEYYQKGTDNKGDVVVALTEGGNGEPFMEFVFSQQVGRSLFEATTDDWDCFWIQLRDALSI